MAKFNAEQQDEIKKTLGFWRALAIEKETIAKGYLKNADAKAYRATFDALTKLIQINNKTDEDKNTKDIQAFWSAATEKWGIDIMAYIPVKLYYMYERYYVAPEISMKDRNYEVARILTAIKKLEELIIKANAHGNALNDRFSFVVSESYQPDDIGEHPNLDVIGFYPLLNAMQNELELLCESLSYNGFQGKKISISDKEQRFIKECKDDIIKYIKRLADYSRKDSLGSFLEQAFSAVRKDRFAPKNSAHCNAEYQIIEVLPFLAEMKDTIIKLKDDRLFYKHHLITKEVSRFKVLGISVHNMVKDVCGTKRSANITSSILRFLFPDKEITDHDVRNWDK